ncbi:MAG: acetyl-CoA hydrolase/transferase family protein [Bacteroidales bacterium]
MNANWRDLYRSRITTAAQAVEVVQSNMRIALGHAAAVPVDTLNALMHRKNELQNVEIVHMFCLGEGAYMQPQMEGHFRHNALFVGGNARKAMAENRADYTPCFFHEIPSLFTRGPLHPNVALIQVSLPNLEGFCSFGVSSDYTKPATHAADIVIAEVNEKMPFIGGDNLIHVSELDYIVETSNPLYELPRPVITDVELAIGEHCAQLVENGATLQLGIGSIPDAVLMSLGNKKRLGIHTEMFSDGVVDLVERGVITGEEKTLHKNKLVATFLMGSQRLYDFVHKNPQVLMYPADYVNDPVVIARNHKMVSINSCIEVDLMGQVVSEAIGPKQISGVGGQVDYVRGVCMTRDGISIMAMPSTAAGGKVSRIVPHLAEGAAVTTSRNDVRYVVTEYGIAQLWGKTLRQRAQELIRIAHPDFRPMLTQAFEKKFFSAHQASAIKI